MTMMIEPITQNDFHLICSEFVGDISPYRIWNKSEMESMISYMIREWLDPYVYNAEIFNPEVSVEKTGQSVLKMTIKYWFGWGNIPITLTTIERRKMRDETTTQILMKVTSEKIQLESLKMLKESIENVIRWIENDKIFTL
jgi:hypothetical protein